VSGGRGLLLAGSVAAVVSVPALAGPQGEQVVHGSASFHRDGARTTITTSQTAIINYQSFNLGSNESVTFVQPGASSRVLNRIDGATPSFIDGSINANGSVYFVNPAGVIFGANSVINVGNLFAAAGRISNEDFVAGINRFTDLSGEVVNHGSIAGAEGVHLLGQRVANFGSIVAPDGLITLAAGDGVLIGERTGHVFAKVTERSGGPAGSGGGVENSGTIDAGSGVVNMGAGDHFALALRQGSSVRGSVVRIEGGDASLVTVQGRIDASGVGTGMGAGGTVEITGGTVALRGAEIDAAGVGGLDGGVVRVGGEVQGTGTLRTAQKTAVDEGSRIDVSATGAGHAGEAIVWSDGATLFRGEIDATAERGSGGFVEVSGKRWLGFQGDVDVSAQGARGTLLLDPKNILIVDDSVLTNEATATNIDDFLDPSVTDGGADLGFADDLTSVLTDGQLNGLLALGDVILRAENDILFGGGAAISITGASSDLDLRALRSIGLDPAGAPASLSINLGTGSFIARANYDLADGSIARVTNRDAGDATISFDANTTITAANAVLQIGTGWDGSQRSGAITSGNINATGGVLLENLATRSGNGNSILTASGATITASRVVARQTNALGGTIGADGNPLSVSASSLNVAGQGVTRLSLGGAGTTIDSTSASIAGVSFGTVNGVSSGGSDLFITTASGLTLSAPVNAGGSALSFSTPLDIEYGVTGATAGGLDFDAAAIGQLSFNELRLTSSAAGVRVVNTAGDVFASTFGTGKTLRVSGTTALLSDAGVAGLPIGSLEVVATSGAAGSLTLNFTVGDLGSATGGVVSLTTAQAVNVGDTDPGGAVFHISEALFNRIRFDNGALTLRSTGGGVTLNDGPANEILGTVGARTPTLTLLSDTGVTSVLADATEQLTVGGLFLEGAGLNLSAGLRLNAGTGTLSFTVTGAGTNISLADGSIGGFGLNSVTIIDDLTFGTFIAEARNGSVALVDSDAVTARNNFSKFAGTTVRLIGEGVSVSGDGDSVLGANVIDLTATGAPGIALSLAPGAVFGAAGQTINLTTPQRIAIGTGPSAELNIAASLITGNQFVFGTLGLTSTATTGGAAVSVLDGGGAFFSALEGRTLSLTGDSIFLFSTNESRLPVTNFTAAGSSLQFANINIIPIGSTVTPGTIDITTAQAIEAGNFAFNAGDQAVLRLPSATLTGWRFSGLALESTGGALTLANDAAGSLFTALASKTLELNAAGAIALRGTTGGGSNSFNPTAGWTVGGGLSIENGVTLASSGTVAGGLTVASGAGLIVNGGATVTLTGTGDAAMISLNGGTLTLNGAIGLTDASELTIDITGVAGAELAGSGSINTGGASVRVRSAGDLALGSGTSANADIDATALGLLSGFGGLAFESTGGAIAVNGDAAFYTALGGGSSLIFDAQTGLSFDATSALALSEDTLIIDALDGGLLRFGTNITGATSGAGGVWVYADTARAERAFSLGATGVDSALVTGTGAFEASDGAGTAFDLTILGDLRAAGLDGTADIGGAVVTVSDGELSSVLGLDAANAGLALTFDDLVVSGGALVTAPGLLSLSTNAGIGLVYGEGTDTPTTAEIDVAEATLRLSFGSLALAGDSVFIGNDTGDAVFTVIESGSGLAATSRAGDVTLAGATGATTLSLADLTLGATGGRVVFGADLGSVTATNSATIAGDNGVLVTGNAGAFTLDLTGGTLSGAVDASGVDLTLNGTIATAGDLSITADLLDVNATLDLNGTDALSLVLGDLDIDATGSIANYTALTLDATAGDIFVGEASGSGVNLTTAELGRLTPGAGATFTLLTDGSVFITNDAGNTVLPTVSGLRVAGSVASAGSGTATLLQLDAVDRSVRIGDGAAADYNITAADIAFFDVATLEVRSDSTVAVGENAAGNILSILGPNFTVRGSTGANAASLAFDARDRDLNLGTSGAGGFELTFADLSRFDADAYSFGTTGAVTLASGIGGDTFNLLSGKTVSLAGSGILAGQSTSATITSTAAGDDIGFNLSVTSAGQTSFNANIASISGQSSFATNSIAFQNTTGVTLADATFNTNATRVSSAGTLAVTSLTTGAGVSSIEFAGSRFTFGTITLGAALSQLTFEATGALTVGAAGTDTVQTSDLDDFATAGATGLRLESDTSVSLIGNGALTAVFDQYATAIGAADGTSATGSLTLDNQANALTLGTAQGFGGEFVVTAADFAGVSAGEVNLRSDANISIADNGAGDIFAALNASTLRFQGAGGGTSAGTGLIRANGTGTLALTAADIATTGGLTLDLDALTTTAGLTLNTGGPIDFSRTTSLNATGVLAITGDLNASGVGLTLAGGTGSTLTAGGVSQLSGAGTYTIVSDSLTIASGSDLTIAGATNGTFLRLGAADIQGTLDTGAGGLTIDAGASTLSWGDASGTVAFNAAEAGRLTFSALALLSDAGVVLVNGTGNTDIASLLSTRNLLVADSATSGAGNTAVVTIDLAGNALGLGTGAGDLVLAAAGFDGSAANGEFRANEYAFTNATDVAVDGLAAGFFTGRSFTFGTVGNEIGSLTINLASASTLSLNALNIQATGEVRFGQNVGGLTASSASTIASGPATIVHETDFTYDGTFNLTGNLLASDGVSDFNLTFQNGTTTLAGSGSTTSTVTARNASILSAGTLTTAAGNDATLSLAEQLTIDGTSTLAVANGRTLTIQSRNAGGIDLGQVTGDGLLIDENELARIALNAGETLTLLTAGDVTLREDAGGALQTFFASGLTFFAGIDASPVAGISASSAVATGLTLAPGEWHSASTLTFDTSITGLDFAANNTLRAVSGINFNAPGTVTLSGGTLTTLRGDLTFAGAASFDAGTFALTAGNSTSGGSITIATGNGLNLINAVAIDAAANDLTVDLTGSPTLTVAAGSSLSTDQMLTLDAGAGAIDVFDNSGGTVVLDGTTIAGLSAAELAFVTSQLTIDGSVADLNGLLDGAGNIGTVSANATGGARTVVRIGGPTFADNIEIGTSALGGLVISDAAFAALNFSTLELSSNGTIALTDTDGANFAHLAAGGGRALTITGGLGGGAGSIAINATGGTRSLAAASLDLTSISTITIGTGVDAVSASGTWTATQVSLNRAAGFTVSNGSVLDINAATTTAAGDLAVNGVARFAATDARLASAGILSVGADGAVVSNGTINSLTVAASDITLATRTVGGTNAIDVGLNELIFDGGANSVAFGETGIPASRSTPPRSACSASAPSASSPTPRPPSAPRARPA
jgi:filamentous hemagglutinin family protein